MRCARCKQEKQPEEMVQNHSTKSGFSSYCKPCAVRNSQESRIRGGWVRYVPIGRTEELRRKRLHRLEIAHGLSRQEAETLAALRTEGSCAICGCAPARSGRWKNLHIDHDHSTDKIRGLICTGCNRAIGFLDDDPGRAEALAYYLRHGGKRA